MQRTDAHRPQELVDVVAAVTRQPAENHQHIVHVQRLHTDSRIRTKDMDMKTGMLGKYLQDGVGLLLGTGQHATHRGNVSVVPRIVVNQHRSTYITHDKQSGKRKNHWKTRNQSLTCWPWHSSDIRSPTRTGSWSSRECSGATKSKLRDSRHTSHGGHRQCDLRISKLFHYIHMYRRMGTRINTSGSSPASITMEGDE